MDSVGWGYGKNKYKNWHDDATRVENHLNTHIRQHKFINMVGHHNKRGQPF